MIRDASDAMRLPHFFEEGGAVPFAVKDDHETRAARIGLEFLWAGLPRYFFEQPRDDVATQRFEHPLIDRPLLHRLDAAQRHVGQQRHHLERRVISLQRGEGLLQMLKQAVGTKAGTRTARRRKKHLGNLQSELARLAACPLPPTRVLPAAYKPRPFLPTRRPRSAGICWTKLNELAVELIPDMTEGGFTARVPDIPAYGEGETEDTAIADLKEALRGYIATFGMDDGLQRLNTPIKLRVVEMDLAELGRA